MRTCFKGVLGLVIGAGAFALTGMACSVQTQEPTESVETSSYAFESIEAGLDAPHCQERCRRFGREVVARCVEAGGARERCLSLGQAYAAGCAERHCDRTEPRCEDRCTAAGAGADCVERRCDGSGPSCRELCVAVGDRTFETCMDAGADRRGCVEAARTASAECALRRCVEPVCEDRCAALARETNALCVEQGGVVERCNVIALETGRACAAEHCGPDRDSCGDRCERRARAALAECQDRGGSDCANDVRTVFVACGDGC